MSATFTIARLGTTGEFVYSSGAAQGEMLVFTPSGQYLQSHGRRGRGPDEFTWINRIIATSRYLHVLDVGNLRWTMLDTLFQPIAAVPLSRFPFDAAVHGDSMLIANIDIPTRELAAIPIHLIGRDGRIHRSFGEEAEGYRSDYEVSMLRQVAPSRGDAFWAARVTRYQLDKWRLDGTLLRSLVRQADWFKPHFKGMVADPRTPPAPWIADLFEDERGLLWVLVLVADPTWHKAIVAEPGGTYRWTSDRNGFLDSIIEVIDPGSGTIVASHRSDIAFSALVDASHLVAYRESSTGVPFVDVWRFRLTTPEGR